MSSTTASAAAGGGGAPEPTASRDLALTARLLGYVMTHKALFGVALLLYPLTAASIVLPPYLVQVILDEVIPARDTERLLFIAGLYLGSILLEYVTGFASQFAMSVLGQRAMFTLRQRLFAHVQRLPAAYFDQNPIGRVLTRLTNDVEALGEVFATGAVTVIGDIVTLIAIVSMMLWLDVKLTLLAFLVVPPLLVLVAIFRVYAREAFRAIRKHLARINAYLAEHIGGMAIVQIFRQERRTHAEFSQLASDYRDAYHSAIKYDAMLYSVVEAIGTCGIAALIWWGAPDLATGVIGAGLLVAFIQYIRRFFVPIRDLSSKYTVLQSAFAASERVFALLDQPIPIDTKDDPQPLERLNDAITLEDVWFAYRTDEESEPEWVLRGVDLAVKRGERVALVGATGSGKTTILKLLNRFYDVQEGAVRIDGVDVRDYALDDLRRLFAVVLQDVYLFSGSVIENLSLDGRVTREAVERAADAVQVTDVLARLPRGYDTEVLERGSNFSVGERQLLAFARALALDPQVLVLDEATSSVDSETEARIQKALHLLLEDRTAIIVAHRLSTIREVDRIVVLKDGKVVEEGDHESLVARGGVYAALAELQFGDSG